MDGKKTHYRVGANTSGGQATQGNGVRADQADLSDRNQLSTGMRAVRSPSRPKYRIL